MVTGIVVGMYFVNPWFIKFNVAPIATVETVTPTSSPICCQKGVAPTR